MTITTIVVEPGKSPHLLETGNELEPFQTIVGGYIQDLKLRSGITLICNEDGLLKQLPFNRVVEGHKIVGTFCLIRTKGTQFASVTKDDIKDWVHE